MKSSLEGKIGMPGRELFKFQRYTLGKYILPLHINENARDILFCSQKKIQATL
jgi:hypothetical protein